MALSLNKQAVAHRLLLGAVRNFSSDFADPIVVHALSASALNVLRDLIRKRGSNYGSEILREALFDIARSRVENRQSITDPDLFNHFDSIINAIEDAIRNDQISSKDEIEISVPDIFEVEGLRDITAPFNFMKHADRDSTGLICMDDLKPVQALAHAISAFSILFPNAQMDDEVESFIEAYVR